MIQKPSVTAGTLIEAAFSSCSIGVLPLLGKTGWIARPGGERPISRRVSPNLSENPTRDWNPAMLQSRGQVRSAGGLPGRALMLQMDPIYERLAGMRAGCRPRSSGPDLPAYCGTCRRRVGA